MIGSMLLIQGCATRVVYVPHGEPVRLAGSVYSKVWVKDASGQMIRSKNRILIPEGWYALPRSNP
jgi:hypothetical protein